MNVSVTAGLSRYGVFFFSIKGFLMRLKKQVEAQKCIFFYVLFIASLMCRLTSLGLKEHRGLFKQESNTQSNQASFCCIVTTH